MAGTRAQTKAKETTEFTSGMTSEADYTVQSTILDSKIRTQKLHQKTHQLRGETAKTERKKLWADTEEVKTKTQGVRLEIAQDNYQGTVKEREINRDSITQRLANKSYKADIQRRQNDGLRQSILNSGATVKVDHTGGFDGVTGGSK
jgi:hypothetical protein